MTIIVADATYGLPCAMLEARGIPLIPSNRRPQRRFVSKPLAEDNEGSIHF